MVPPLDGSTPSLSQPLQRNYPLAAGFALTAFTMWVVSDALAAGASAGQILLLCGVESMAVIFLVFLLGERRKTLSQKIRAAFFSSAFARSSALYAGWPCARAH